MLCDSHCHLDFEDFDTDRDQVVKRASASGVGWIINPGIDAESSRKAVILSETYETVLPAVGIHPNSTSGTTSQDIKEIESLSLNPGVVAIGEIGLDFYRDRSPRNKQVKICIQFLELAGERGLPVILHFRGVESEVFDLLGKERLGKLKGVFHCFGGSADFAREAVELGYYIGFTGPLTYKGSDRTEIARAVPLKKCLIETDAPFLTPIPHRGKRNEPAYVSFIAEKLAEIKRITAEEAEEAIIRNSRSLFRIGI